MKRITALLLAVLMLVGCFSMSALAEGTAVIFDLTCNGKNDVIAEVGDIIDVTFTILRTDSDSDYDINALQNYIIYDEDFFEFVDGSAVCTHVDSKGDPIGFAGLVKAISRNKIYMNDMLDTLPASRKFGTFQMKIIGRSGSGMIKNAEVKAYLSGSVSVDITCKDLTVTIGTPLPEEYTVTYDAGSGVQAPAPETVEETQSVTLPQVTREGYELEGWSDGTEVYRAGTTYTPESSITLTAEWIHNAPTVRTQNESSEGAKDGKLLNTTTEMEYSADGKNWTTCGAGETTGLPAGTYQVRYAATETEKAGKSVNATIHTDTPEYGGGEDEDIYLVPISGDTTGIRVAAEVVGRKAKLKVNPSEIEAVIGETVKTGDVVIDLTGLPDDVIGLVIPKETLNAISNASNSATNDTRSVVIRLKVATITLDASALKAAQNSSNYDLELVIEPKKLSSLDAAQQAALKGRNVIGIYDIYMMENGQRITDLGGGTITISINEMQSESLGNDTVKVLYVAPDGALTEISARVDKTLNIVIFKTTHLSIYAIITEPASETDCPRDESCPITPYVDTDKTMWWHDGIHFCVENGLMIGLDSSTFAPNMTIDRAMAVMILWRISGRPAVNADRKPFDDVDTGCWYTEPICWAKSSGVVEGYGDGIFGPVDHLTREQLAVILYRFAAPVSNTNVALPFNDASSISGWAVDAVRWCYANGIVMGRDTGCFDPQGTATRAEAAAMFQRFCRIGA